MTNFVEINDLVGLQRIIPSKSSSLHGHLKSNFGSFLRICFFCAKKTHFCLTSIEDISTTTWSWEKIFICRIIYSTRSVDLWYFQTHKLFFSARMDGVYFRSFPKLTKLIKIDQNLHQIPNLRVQNDGLRDILVHVG